MYVEWVAKRWVHHVFVLRIGSMRCHKTLFFLFLVRFFYMPLTCWACQTYYLWKRYRKRGGRQKTHLAFIQWTHHAFRRILKIFQVTHTGFDGGTRWSGSFRCGATRSAAKRQDKTNINFVCSSLVELVPCRQKTRLMRQFVRETSFFPRTLISLLITEYS